MKKEEKKSGGYRPNSGRKRKEPRKLLHRIIPKKSIEYVESVVNYKMKEFCIEHGEKYSPLVLSVPEDKSSINCYIRIPVEIFDDLKAKIDELISINRKRGIK